MVRNRFWSTFSKFTDEEIEDEIAELEIAYAGAEDLEFKEKLLLLVGVKIQS
jgi:hypothetical protein